MILFPTIRRFCLWFIATVVTVACSFIAGFIYSTWIWMQPPQCDQMFHNAIATADKIVVRNGGFDWDVEGTNKVLFVVTDRSEVQKLASRLHFKGDVVEAMRNSCLCDGWPGIDWYHGKRRIAVMSDQHEEAIRWRGFSPQILGFGVGHGDGPLTDEAAQYLVDWFAEHGLTEMKKRHDGSKRAVDELERLKRIHTKKAMDEWTQWMKSEKATRKAEKGIPSSSGPLVTKP